MIIFIKKQYNIHKETINNFLWRFLQTFSKQGIIFVIFILSAKLLNPYDFGLYNYILAIVFFLIMFGDFGISTATSKYVAECNVLDKNKLKHVLFSSGLIIFSITILITSFVLIFGHQYLKDKYYYILYLLPIIFLSPMSSLYDGIYRGLKKFKQLAIISTCIGLISLFFIYFFIKYYGLIGALISQSFFYLILLFGLALGYREFHFKLNVTAIKEIGKYSFVYGLAILGNYLFIRFGILILGHFQYITEIGIYELLNKIFMILLLPFTLLGQVVAPNFSEFAIKKQYALIYNKTKKYTLYFFILGLLLGIFIFLAIPPIIKFFLPNYYNQLFLEIFPFSVLIFIANVWATTVDTGILVPSGFASLMANFYLALGLLLLLYIYQFLKQFLIKKQILIIIFLLSINVIFQLFTYVTVLDPINLIFLFISLIYFVSGLEKEDAQNIYLSGIIAGIGISIKYHALIFYFPIFILFLFFYKKIRKERRFLYLLLLLPNFLLQTIIFRMSFRFLPTNFLLYFSLFIILIVIQFFAYKKINNLSIFFENILKGKTKIFYSIIISSSLIIFYLIFSIDWIKDLLSDFITDKYLIFNWNMYSSLLNNYNIWLTPIIFYFSVSMFFLIILTRNKKVKLLVFSFLTSSLIYFFLTSKVLYFHEYYHHIIIFTFILLFSFIYYLTKINASIFSKLLIYLTLFSIIFSSTLINIEQTGTRMSLENPDIKNVAEYLNNNMSDNQFFIFNSLIPTTIGFYSDRFSLVEELNTDYDKEFVEILKKDLAKNTPFGEEMKKYNIKYYVSENGPDDKNNDFAYLFLQDKPSSQNISERTILILCKENNFCYEDNRYLSNNGYDSFEKNIKPSLRLTKKINKYYIYEFR